MKRPTFAVATALAIASCADVDAADPTAEAAEEATATHRRICGVVGPLAKNAAESAFCSCMIGRGRPNYCSTPTDGWTPYRPGWDGISQPPPAVFAWFQCAQDQLAPMADYAACMDAASLLGTGLLGARRYEGLVIPNEVGNTSNSVDSIYANRGPLGIPSGYDAGLPVKDFYAAIAAHAAQGLLAPVLFPPRSSFP